MYFRCWLCCRLSLFFSFFFPFSFLFLSFFFPFSFLFFPFLLSFFLSIFFSSFFYPFVLAHHFFRLVFLPFFFFSFFLSFFLLLSFSYLFFSYKTLNVLDISLYFRTGEGFIIFYRNRILANQDKFQTHTHRQPSQARTPCRHPAIDKMLLFKPHPCPWVPQPPPAQMTSLWL